MENNLNEFVAFQTRRELIGLCKSFLVILEGVRDNEWNINEETFNQLRKKVLDNSNSALRNLEEHLNKTNITLKTE